MRALDLCYALAEMKLKGTYFVNDENLMTFNYFRTNKRFHICTKRKHRKHTFEPSLIMKINNNSLIAFFYSYGK